ncbi:MAG: uroporphyrinogen-III synthase, partial [Deltaproteobacteria bacterium]|nr:uroporphyrinogen-III synthase [Deltaproteobacteria bacterium]
DWAGFTSPNGVAYFWRELDVLGLDARAVAATAVAAIGPATADALAARGIRADFVPQSHVAEDLLAGLVAQGAFGKRFLIPRAETARDVLPQGLREAGADVSVVPVYRTLPASDREKNADALLALFAAGKIRYITFASSSTVTNFLEAVPAKTLRRFPELRFACIGPVTAGTLKDAGLACHVMPETFTIPALVAAVAADAVANP